MPTYGEIYQNALTITDKDEATNQVYNVAYGERTNLNELYAYIKEMLSSDYPHVQGAQPEYRDFRAGDVRHSLANISKIEKLLGYNPEYSIKSGLEQATKWYISNLG